jgi:hypothetical protein
MLSLDPGGRVRQSQKLNPPPPNMMTKARPTDRALGIAPCYNDCACQTGDVDFLCDNYYLIAHNS